ncbi:hypothetical protein [Geoglobus sp.]
MRRVAMVVLLLAALVLFGCAQKEASKVAETTPTPTPTQTQSETSVENLTTDINDTFKDVMTELNQIQDLEKAVQELNTLNFEI